MFRWIVRVVVLVGVGFGLGACSDGGAGSVRWLNTDISHSDLKASFTLRDLQGRDRTLASYQGQVVVMFFGYMHCPDICPTTLQQWKEVRARLGEKAKDLQVVFVSVDPSRDTPELLANYVPRFDPSFQALYGPDEALQPLLKGLKVLVAKVQQKGRDDSNYTIDHTAASFVFDRQGQPRLLVRHQAEVPAIVKDLTVLLAES